MCKKIFEPKYPAELYTSRPNETALLSPIYDFTFKSIFSQETDESKLALKSFLSAVLNREKEWKAPKVYQISILNFHYKESDNETLTWYTLQSDSGKKLTDRQNVIFIDLPKIREKLGTPVEKLSHIERWGMFFSYVDDECQKEYIDEILKQEEGIMAAERIVKNMSKANDNWYAQNSRYIAECDYNTSMSNARQEGIAEGAQHQAIEDAKSFYANGASIELIASSLKMTFDEVKEIVKK